CLRIHEVPVDWIDDADSRVKLVATAVADLRGIVRLGTGLARGTVKVPALGDPSPPGLAGWHGLLVTQLARFTVVGVASTVAYVLLFLLLRGALGAQWANAVSLLVTAIANTAVNRRVEVRDPGPVPGGAPSGARSDRVRDWAGADIGRAGVAAPHRPTARPGRRGERAGRGEPAGHHRPLRSLPQLGVPRLRPRW